MLCIDAEEKSEQLCPVKTMPLSSNGRVHRTAKSQSMRNIFGLKKKLLTLQKRGEVEEELLNLPPSSNKESKIDLRRNRQNVPSKKAIKNWKPI